MKNMLCLRYTAFALLKDPQLGYPESLLARITELGLPDGNIFSHVGSPGIIGSGFRIYSRSDQWT